MAADTIQRKFSLEILEHCHKRWEVYWKHCKLLCRLKNPTFSRDPV